MGVRTAERITASSIDLLLSGKLFKSFCRVIVQCLSTRKKALKAQSEPLPLLALKRCRAFLDKGLHALAHILCGEKQEEILALAFQSLLQRGLESRQHRLFGQ